MQAPSFRLLVFLFPLLTLPFSSLAAINATAHPPFGRTHRAQARMRTRSTAMTLYVFLTPLPVLPQAFLIKAIGESVPN